MDPVTAIPALVELVLKGGVTAVLMIALVLAGVEIKRLRKQASIIFRQRDHARLAFTIVKSAADAAGVKYDLRNVDDLLKDDAELAGVA